MGRTVKIIGNYQPTGVEMIEIEEIHAKAECYICAQKTPTGDNVVLHDNLLYIPLDWGVVFSGRDTNIRRMYFQFLCPRCFKGYCPNCGSEKLGEDRCCQNCGADCKFQID